MSRFLKMRLATALWGFAVSFAFTGSLVVAVPLFAAQFLGNSVLMWWFSR